MAETAEAFLDDVLGSFYKVQLLIVLKKGNSAAKPPKGGDDKGDGQAGHLGDADLIGAQYEDEADDKRNAAADIAPGIAFGGDIIHALRSGHIVDHGIIEDQTGGIAHLGNDKQDQKEQPVAGKAQDDTTDDTDHKGDDKNGFFKALCVGDRAKDRS